MSFVYIKTPPAALATPKPLLVGRNGFPVDGQRLKALGHFINTNAAARLKFLGAKSVLPTVALSAEADTVTWRYMVHTSPNATNVIASMVSIPAATTSSNVSPRCWWVRKTLDITANPATVSATATEDTIYLPDRNTGTIIPDDFTTVETSIAVAANTTYGLELHCADYGRIISVALFEETFEGEALNPSGRTLVDTTPCLYGAPIYDRDAAGYLSTALTVYKRGGAHYFGWNCDAGTAITRTTGTYVNILDDSYTSWNAAAPGFYCQTGDRGTRESENVPVRIWAYASTAAGSGGDVQFVRNGATVGTIGSISTTAGYWHTTANLTSANASDKVDVHFQGDGTNALSIYACGAFDFVA